jgi:hypothetical protein
MQGGEKCLKNCSGFAMQFGVLSGEFLQAVPPHADTPYSGAPIKEIGGCLHNESIDAPPATPLNESPP